MMVMVIGRGRLKEGLGRSEARIKVRGYTVMSGRGIDTSAAVQPTACHRCQGRRHVQEYVEKARMRFVVCRFWLPHHHFGGGAAGGRAPAPAPPAVARDTP